MKEKLAEIRFINFERLIEEAGTVAELARRSGYDKAAYLYQVRAKTLRPNGQPLQVGSRMAAKLEVGMGKPKGWMDIDHSNLETVTQFTQQKPVINPTETQAVAPVQPNSIQNITLAFTGASGMPYGIRLLEQLLSAGKNVYLVYSQAAQIVAQQEMGFKLASDARVAQQELCAKFSVSPDRLQIFAQENWFAPIASGTNTADAMIICPASMGTLAAIAHGLSENLLERAADVTIKERRPLIIVPRETPFSIIHLENMLKLAQAGCTILPPSAGFYTHPQTVDDMINFVVARILDQLNIAHNLLPKWGE